MPNRTIVLVGLMGAGKTAIGKRLAAKLGYPFYDADQEIEKAAGITINEIFARHGEAHFRAGEKRVIQRLLGQETIVLALGGGAFMDADTRALIRERATSIWLRSPLPVLLSRLHGRTHRPLLNNGNPDDILARLSLERSPVYAQADITIDGSEGSPELTMQSVLKAVVVHSMPRKVDVNFPKGSYQVVIGAGLLERAGALMADLLPQRHCVILTDEMVADLHLGRLTRSLDEVSISYNTMIIRPGEASKTLETWGRLIDGLLAQRIERNTTIIALGGGVVGDLAGFVAAATLRGLPFVQIPTTLLAQVDSSVGGKTGVNTQFGKNLVGAFHQPILVLVDTGTLSTLPIRERRAGYAEIVKAGLIADADLYRWCEINGAMLLDGDLPRQAEAIERAVRFKAAVVGDDEREEKLDGGRALLNLGHTFAHALEAETGYGGDLLHGEAVATGLVLAMQLSVLLGFCPREDAGRLTAHLSAVGLPTRIAGLSADKLVQHMKQDKKIRNGRLTFILSRGIGKAFTSNDVTDDLVRQILLESGAAR